MLKDISYEVYEILTLENLDKRTVNPETPLGVLRSIFDMILCVFGYYRFFSWRGSIYSIVGGCLVKIRDKNLISAYVRR